MGATNVDPGTDSDGTRTESAWLSLNLEIGPRLIPYVQHVPQYQYFTACLATNRALIGQRDRLTLVFPMLCFVDMDSLSGRF